MDSNGTHVVQTLIKTFKEERLGYLIEEITVSDKVLLEVASNCHGICVIKALIDNVKTYKDLMASHLVKLSFELSSDPFGNYAI